MNYLYMFLYKILCA